MSLRRITLLVIGLAVVGGSPTLAAIPSSTLSTVESCPRVCPAGDMNYHVVIRDVAGTPIAGSTVLVDFCNCPSLFLCPPWPGSPYSLSGGCIVVMTTDAAGVADIPIRAGGKCTGPVLVSADGILLTTRKVYSPDLNADGAVDATDQAILAATLAGESQGGGDLNCSGATGTDDVAIQNAHLGHSCAAVVPVLPSSWGRIKMIYR